MIYIIQSNSNIIYENLAMEQCLRIMVQESKGKWEFCSYGKMKTVWLSDAARICIHR